MGGKLWQYETPYEPDAASALRRLQAEVYRRAGYDLAQRLDERTRDMLQAIRWCEEEDPYNLLEHYRDGHRRLSELADGEIPTDTEAQIALLRTIESIGSASAPGILGIEGISQEWAERKVQVLTAERMKEVFGTTSPSRQDVHAVLGRLADLLSWGPGICFPVYDGHHPVSWHFMGCTVD